MERRTTTSVIPVKIDFKENLILEEKIQYQDQEITPKIALDALNIAMIKDNSYAWSWHCNLAMMAYDAGAPHKESNERAASFMRILFDIDVTEYPEYKAIFTT